MRCALLRRWGAGFPLRPRGLGIPQPTRPELLAPVRVALALPAAAGGSWYPSRAHAYGGGGARTMATQTGATSHALRSLEAPEVPPLPSPTPHTHRSARAHARAPPSFPPFFLREILRRGAHANASHGPAAGPSQTLAPACPCLRQVAEWLSGLGLPRKYSRAVLKHAVGGEVRHTRCKLQALLLFWLGEPAAGLLLLF